MPENDKVSVQRGDYGTNLLPTALFVAGRLASGPIQYFLIQSQPLSRLFNVPPPPTGGFIHILGLSQPLPRLPFITALMPTVLSLKHTLWLTTYCNERITLQFAFFGILADFMYEFTSSLVFSGASINPLWSETGFYVGTALYFTGIAIELVAELQRVAFKARPENKGKLCTKGFWGLTRHINYTANVLFGFGYGLATGGPGYSIATAGMYLSNFVFNAIPSHEEYCAGKYGQQWKQYEKDVPWKLIPWVY